jgi:hypothetical protein
MLESASTAGLPRSGGSAEHAQSIKSERSELRHRGSNASDIDALVD